MSTLTTNHSQRKHSRISPSGLKSLQLCPGYEPEDRPEGPAAKRGTFLHEIMETGKLPKLPWPDFMKQGDVQVAEKVLAIVKEADSRSEYAPFKEVELDFRPLGFKDFEKGHADRVIVLEDVDDDPTHMEMIDFKFGAWEVDSVEKNVQFRAYSLGVFLMFETVQRVTVRIIQPELSLDESHTFIRSKDLEIIKTQIGSIIRRRHKWLETKNGKMLKSDPDNCSFCGVQATCPIWQAYMVKLANESNVLETQVMPIQNLEDFESADPEELVRIFRWIKPMEDYLKKVKRFALQVYDTGRMDSSALQLVEKKGDATVVDTLFVRDHLVQNYGVNTDEFVAATSIGLTRIRELASARAKQGEKGKTEEQVIKELSDEGVIQYGDVIRYLQLNRKKTK